MAARELRTPMVSNDGFAELLLERRRQEAPLLGGARPRLRWHHPGMRSIFGRSSRITSHGCALATKMSRLGLYQPGSSKLPA